MATRHAMGTGRGAVLGAAAAGLAAGLAANLGRKMAVQAATAMSGDWLEGIKTEHRLTLNIFDAIQRTSNAQTAKRGMLLMQLKHALSKHAFEEENVLYPALRDANDSEHADKLNHDHGYVKQFLYDLDIMPKNDPAWLGKVSEFRTLIETHAREEEEEIFPALRSGLSADQNKKLTMLMNKEGFKIA